MTCKHLLQGAPDCVFCHRDQLKSELSLAEEGLANYQQEVERLQRNESVYDSMIDAANAENERLRAALSDLNSQVERFCVEQGEWEFYTGPAQQALGRSKYEVHEKDLCKLVEAARSAEPQTAEHGAQPQK